MMCLIAALAMSTSPVDAAIAETHEINFDKMVPCVGEIVHLKGPIRVSLTFVGKSLTNVAYSVQGIRGTGESTGRTYSASLNQRESTDYSVRNNVGRGHITLTFEVIGRLEGNSGIPFRFWAKQIVGLEFRNTLQKPDWEALKVCVMPPS